MLRPLAIGLLLIATPALGAPPAAPGASLYHQQRSRSIGLQNWSTHTIVSAKVQTSDGRMWNLAKNRIAENQGAEVIVPAQDCIANVTVKLDNGRTLDDHGLHACHSTHIVVRNNNVSIAREAVPGAQQHGTPG